jgi:geranylgeranyl transferase type-2 subunit alpha
MHGLLIRDKKELSEEEKAAEVEAASSASCLLSDVVNSKRSRDYSMDSFNKCMELLKLNPELSLAWNYRREIILHSESLGEKNNVMEKELGVLNMVMVDLQMTKSYCLWNHRRWLLLQIRSMNGLSDDILKTELELIKTILKLDARNFHAWSYRQWLRQNFPSQIEPKLNDLEYSGQLIEKDFSNYSAWFLRSWTVERRGAKIEPEEELDVVWNALFTEPNDQSCWQYHDWLLRRFPELAQNDLEYMGELEQVVEQKDSKYLLLAQLRYKNFPRGERKEIVEKLVHIDPIRKGFYLDQL